jgi:hypothetical protein
MRSKLVFTTLIVVGFVMSLIIGRRLLSQAITDKSEDDDIARLVVASKKQERAVEWAGAVPEDELVARHGKHIVPKLMALLDENKDVPTDLHLAPDQDVMLALCLIYHEKPFRHFYLVRATYADNRLIYEFWKRRVQESVDDHK